MTTPEQLKQEVLHGLWGDGDTRRQRLENAGYSWIEIQSLINKEFGSKAVIASDEEIAQEVLDGKWGLGAMRRQRIINAGFDYNKIQSLANKIASAKKPAGTTTTSVPTVPSQPNIEVPAGKIDVGGGGSQHVNPNGPGAGSSLTTDFTKYNEFLNGEVRYNALSIKSPELAKKLADEDVESSKKRYDYYKRIVTKK